MLRQRFIGLSPLEDLLSPLTQEEEAKDLRARSFASKRLPFGYRYQDGRAVEHPEQWPQARRMVGDLLASGMDWSGTIRGWEKDVGVMGRSWSASGLRAWWANPMLQGLAGECPALIEPKEWQAAARILERRARVKGRAASKHPARLFTGLIRCIACRKVLEWDPRPQHRQQVVARIRKPAARKYRCNTPRCRFHGRTVREEVIRQLVAAALVKRGKEMVRLIWGAPSPVDGQARERLLEQIDQLRALISKGVEGLKRAEMRLRNQLVEMDTPPDEFTEETKYEDTFWDPAAFIGASDEHLRPVLLWFVRQIHYHGKPNTCTITRHRPASKKELPVSPEVLVTALRGIHAQHLKARMASDGGLVWEQAPSSGAATTRMLLDPTISFCSDLQWGSPESVNTDQGYSRMIENLQLEYQQLLKTVGGVPPEELPASQHGTNAPIES
jgi:hypothetical protein